MNFPAIIDFEMEEELRALQTWYGMLDEGQKTTAIYSLIQKTTLAQVRFLTEVLRLREMEILEREALDRLRSLKLWSGAVAQSKDQCYSTPFRNPEIQLPQPISQNVSPPRPFHSPRPPSTAPSIPEISYSEHNSELNSTFTSPTSSSSTTISTSSPSIPPTTPLPILSSTSLSTSTKDTMVTLCRLTIGPSFPSFPSFPPLIKQKRRKRKIPPFPKDAEDPEWLMKWLKKLRLHKYANRLQGVTPSELLFLGEKELVGRGVDTLGARTKLLVAFKEARESME